MTAAFDVAVKIVLKSEGYFAIDLGGETYYGIARKYHPDVQPWPPTKEQAIEIYRDEYWDRFKCGEFPFPLDVALFDAVVNQPAVEIIAELQRALKVEADGVVGPATIAAARGGDPWERFALFSARRALRYATKSRPQEQIGLLARLFRTQRALLVAA